MTKRITLFFSIIIICFYCNPFKSEDSVTEFYGYVRDENGNPIDSAVIYVWYTNVSTVTGDTLFTLRKILNSNKMSGIALLLLKLDTTTIISAYILDYKDVTIETFCTDSVLSSGEHKFYWENALPGKYYFLVKDKNDRTIKRDSIFITCGFTNYTNSEGKFVLPDRIFSAIDEKAIYRNIITEEITDSVLLTNPMIFQAQKNINPDSSWRKSEGKALNINKNKPVYIGDFLINIGK